MTMSFRAIAEAEAEIEEAEAKEELDPVVAFLRNTDLRPTEPLRPHREPDPNLVLEWLAEAMKAYPDDLAGIHAYLSDRAGSSYSAQLSIRSLCRHPLTQKYSWAVPSGNAIKMIAKHGPVIEIGAGTGYWAHLLRKAGVDVLAYDRAPPWMRKNSWHHKARKTWTSVHYGRPNKAKKHPDRALFLCWPPYNDPMAADCLRHYTKAGGETVIYVGEGGYGCTGDEVFHDALKRDWEQAGAVMIPQWYGLHDELWVYRRK